MTQNQTFDKIQEKNNQQIKTQNISSETQKDPETENKSQHTSSQNKKWQKIIEENQKQDEAIPFLIQQESFKSQNKIQDYERQKSMMQSTAKTGRQFLIEKKYHQASKQLSKTLMAFQFIAKNYAQTIPKEYLKEMMINTVLPAHNNLALCYLKMKNYKLVVSFTNQVVGQDPSNVKARYRRGMALKELKKTDEAIKDFQFVIKLDPQMRSECNQRISECRTIESEQRKRSKQSAKRFISGYESSDRKAEQTPLQFEPTQKRQNNDEITKIQQIPKIVEEKKGIVSWIKAKCEQCSKIFSRAKESPKEQ